MKNFVTKSIYISFPIIIALIAMEFLLRNIPNDYSYKRSYLDKHAAEIETLILGSSHAYYGLNPAFFSGKAFNASHISQSFDYDYALFEKYQVNFKKLKTVVLPISYFSPFGKIEEGSEAWRVKNYVLYYKLETSKNLSHHSEVLSHPIKANIQRLISYYVHNKSSITCTELGLGSKSKKEVSQDLDETGKAAAIRHTKVDIYDSKSQKTLKENKYILKKIIEQCSKRNIKVLFLTTPTFKSYYKNLNKEQLDFTIEMGKNLEKENNNVRYFNFISDCRFDVEDFQDADHLSVKGAEKLSKVVNEKLESWN